MSFPGFSPAALEFLRKLKRNNRREWFQPRIELYEREIKTPMLALIGEINAELVHFAPRYAVPPAKALMRIYRDTRFSVNKAPYKTHVSAIFPRAGADRTSGACFYFHFTAEELLMFAGVWNPPPDELRLIRPFLAEHYRELNRLLRSRNLRALFGELQGEKVSRVPHGFRKEHPAAELVRGKQWYFECTLSSRVLLKGSVVSDISQRFRVAAPFVEFTNQPLLARRQVRDPVLETLAF